MGIAPFDPSTSAPSEPTLRTNGVEKASIFRSSFGSFRAYAQDERYGESFHLPFVLRLLQSLRSGRTVWRKLPSSVRPSAPSEPMLRTNGGQKASIFSSSFGSFRAYAQDERWAESLHLQF